MVFVRRGVLALAMLGMAVAFTPAAQATSLPVNTTIGAVGALPGTFFADNTLVASIVDAAVPPPASATVVTYVWKNNMTGFLSFGGFGVTPATDPLFSLTMFAKSFTQSNVGGSPVDVYESSAAYAGGAGAGDDFPGGGTSSTSTRWVEVGSIGSVVFNYDNGATQTKLFVVMTKALGYVRGTFSSNQAIGGGNGTSFTPAAIPEPASLALAFTALPVLGLLRLRRKARA